MNYSFAPLYVRILFFLLLGIILASILFLWTKKHKITARVTIQIVCAAVFLGCSFSTIYALINPQLKTITCTFIDYQKSGDQINPFSTDCEWLCEGKSLWIELDAITRNIVFQNFEEMESGKTYVVTYEARENLILGIEKK